MPPKETNTENISFDEWLSYPDHPTQRDTPSHARKASKIHLKSPDLEIHANVSAILHPIERRFYKLDGHTRTYLWENDPVWTKNKPTHLCVKFFYPETYANFLRYYRAFDNPAAAEHTSEALVGLCRYLGFDFESSILTQMRGMKTALCLVFGNSPREVLDWENNLRGYQEELLVMDSLLGKKRVPSGVLAAFLLSLKGHGDKVVPFWKAYMDGEFKAESGEMDSVGWAIRFTETLPTKSSQGGVRDLCEAMLSCINRYTRSPDLLSKKKPSSKNASISAFRKSCGI